MPAVQCEALVEGAARDRLSDLVRQAAVGQHAVASLRLRSRAAKGTFSPLAELLKERTSPELLYLEAKWSSVLSFGVSCDLLGEVLPIRDELNTTTLRNNLHHVAERVEKELGEERESFLAETMSPRAEEQPSPSCKPALPLIDRLKQLLAGDDIQNS